MTEDEIIYHSSYNRDLLVSIVDSDPETCKAMSLLFRLEGFQTNFSLNSQQFLMNVERRRPDVFLINLKVGDDSGLGLLRHVKSLCTGAPVVMLADDHDVEVAVAAMRLGAIDVVVKPMDTERLLTRVRNELRRDVRLGVMKQGARPVEITGFSQLTNRERQVLDLIANGVSNKDAAKSLDISHRTVEVHRLHLMRKLGARNAADLVRIVLTA